MKRFLFTLSLIVVSATAIISLCSWDYAPLEPASHNSANITAEDDWILIGEVTLSKYNGIGKITPCGDKFLKPHRSSSSSISGV